MLNEVDSIKVLRTYFSKNKISDMKSLLRLLETTSRISVFRRLQKMNYISSYTHAGGYYTLLRMSDFDASGLWYFNAIGFSKAGNLKKTIQQLVEKSESGKTHEELETQLHIRVQNTLLDLVRTNKIMRRKVAGDYIYFTADKSHAKKQMLHREKYRSVAELTDYPDWIIIEVLASIIRITEAEEIEPSKVVSDIASRKIMISVFQVEHILNKLNLKKTLGSL